MKRVVAALLMFALILTGFLCFLPEASESKAAETVVAIEGDYTTVEKANWVEDENKVPYLEGFLFAGYYNDANGECTMATASSKSKATHAKFVREDMLNVKVQVTNGVVQDSYITDKNGNKPYVGKYIIRFISSVESLNYASIGFVVEYKDGDTIKTLTNKTSRVYEKIDSTIGTVGGTVDTYNFSPKIVGQDSEYFITAKLPVAVGNEAVDYTVKAFYETLDGTRVYGTERTVAVNDGEQDTELNMQMKSEFALTVGEVLNVTYGDEQGTATVLSYNAKTGVANVRVALADGTTKAQLGAATKFVITQEGNAENTAEGIYQNFYGTPTASDQVDAQSNPYIVPDTSWYDVNPSATVFQIATVADLYGLADIVNSGRDTFVGKEVHVVKDITVNKGTAVKTAFNADGTNKAGVSWSKATGVTTLYGWIPIGTETYKFAGIFDGNGNEISGIYLYDTGHNHQGLFGYAGDNAEFKNFKFTNSFLDSRSSQYKGSVVGRGGAKFENLYIDVILRYSGASNNAYAGGIVGGMSATKGAKIEFINCWYNGQLYHYGGAYVGGFLGMCQSAGASINFTDCLFTGTAGAMAANYFGTFVGAATYGSTTKINMTNCMEMGFVGKLTGSNSGSIVGQLAGGTDQLNLTNVYISRSEAYYGKFGNANGPTIVNSAQVTHVDMIVDEAGLATKFPLLSGQKYSAWVCDSAINDTDRGTPILRTYAEWWKEQYKVTPDTSWYTDGTTTEYTITTAEELYGLAELSKTYTFEGVTIKLGANIVLNEANKAILEKWKHGTGAPINQWTPIGTSSKPFAGTFDGQGHTISGLYLNATTEGAGMFGTTAATAVIQDFKLVDSFMKTSAQYMGLVGTGAFNTIEKVYTNAIMISSSDWVGGFVGSLKSNGGTTYIKNCWFDGEILQTGDYGAAGFVGQDGEALYVAFENCLSTGSITGTAKVGGFMGWLNNYKAKDAEVFTNCLSVANIQATGSAAYCGTFFGQANTSPYGVTATNTYGVGDRFIGVYRASDGTYETKFESATYVKTRYAICGSNVETLFAGSEAWRNDNTTGWNNTDRGTPILEHFADWWIARQPERVDTVDISWYNDSDTEFTLNDAADLGGLAYLANNVDDFAGKTIYLGKNITINNVNETILASWKNGTVPSNQWTPIGSSTMPFAGTFDGQGYTISGLYLNATTEGAGMFGTTAATAVIRDFKLVDSYMKTSAPYLGLVGTGAFNTIEKVYTNAIMVSSTNLVGGFVGNLKSNGGTTYFKNCWFDGEILQTAGYGVAGFVAQDGEKLYIDFENCLVTGTITGVSKVGGFMGWLNNYVAQHAEKFTNCLSVANIKATGSPEYCGTFFGQANTSPYGVTATNTYGVGDRFIGVYRASDGTYETKFESATYVKTREFICSADVAALFASSDAWRNDNTTGWNDTDRGTPILEYFADWWIAREPEKVDTVDISWYNDSDTEFTLNDLADLRGLIYLANNVDDFAGKTIYLGQDIKINNVNATILASWKNGTVPSNQWEPIGTSSKPFAGTFDGQGYTISGLYLNATTAGAGMFGTTASTAVIRDFKLVDSYMKSTADNLGLVGTGTLARIEYVYTNAVLVSSADMVGGFAGSLGSNGGTTYFKNCWFDGEIIQTGTMLAGGFLGQDNNPMFLEFENCLVTGSITGVSKVGGFMGWLSNYKAKDAEVFKNCLSVANIKATANPEYCGTFFGQANTSPYGVTATNTYGVGDRFIGVYRPQDGSYETTFESATYVKTREFICSADVAALFAGSDAWRNDNETGWNDTDRGTPILEYFADWWIAREPERVNTVDLSWYDENATEFTLNDLADLRGLAYLANNVENFAEKTIYLGKNITINNVDESILAAWKQGTVTPANNWTPIGTTTQPFAGTFDGNGNVISGLYLKSTASDVGLFGSVAHGSVIRNFKLIDSYIYGNGSVGLIGSGLASRIEMIYTNAIIESTGENAGGILGKSLGFYTDKTVATEENWAQGIMVISQCWFDGEINMLGTAYSGGGILGAPKQRSRIDFINCLYTGHITSARTDIYTRLGGFIGWENSSAQYNFTNCLSAGSFAAEDTSYVGGFIGNIGGDGVSFTNCHTTYDSADPERVGIGTGTNAIAYTNTTTSTREQLRLEDISELFPTSDAWASDTGYNSTNRGTPLLAIFKDWWIGRQDEGDLEVEPDDSWYTNNPDATEFIINNKAQLITLPGIAKSENFAGKTIKLGNNIVLNTPDVQAWANGTVPGYTWTPIGTKRLPFAGTFDGQGYKISGVYIKSNTAYVGLFGLTATTGEIKNLRLMDSYVEQTHTTADGGRYTGSVVAYYTANMVNVYSNATVVSKCYYTGGLIGNIKPNGTATISDCWFDGKLLLADNVRYSGGVVGRQEGGKLYFTNVLTTGFIQENITTDQAMFIGGILGANTSVAGVGTYFESVVSAGTYAIPVGERQIASIVGYLNNGTEDSPATYTFNNVFATREYNKTHSNGTGYIEIEGQVIQTADKDRFIGYHPQDIRDVNNNVLVEEQKLDFTNSWTIRTNGVPIPSALVNAVDGNTLVDASNFTTELGLDILSGDFSSASVEGAGEYVVKGSADKTAYDTYLAQLETLGFTKFADNVGTSMATDGVYTATYYKEATANKGEWVINVTFVTKESQIYVVINTDTDSMPDTLINSGDQNATGDMSLSMVEDKAGVNITGNCFVIQLPNGHFIINDGNTDGGSGAILKAYLQSLVGEGNPIYIDAWTITHFHNDHAGALMDMANDATLRANVYVKAIYANEVSSYATTYFEDRTVNDINTAIQAVKRLTKSPTDASAPDIYQVHMGQRYYFNGVTMDIINTPDQLIGVEWDGGPSDGGNNENHIPDVFNSSSVNFVFTMSNGKKILLGGDTTMVNMKYIISAYGENNQTLANINVFAAYHHGKNVMNEWNPTRSNSQAGYGIEINAIGNNTWADFLLKNSNNGSDYKFDVMLFPNYKKFEATVQTVSGQKIYVGDDNSVIYPWNIGTMNQYYADNSNLHFTTGYQDSTDATEDARHGTVKITFTSDGTISYEALDSVH